MKVLVIGATGTIGAAVADALAGKHEVVQASRSGDVAVDIGQPDSTRQMFDLVGKVDAVVCCAGDARFGPLAGLSDADFEFSLQNKVMGQVNIVRFGMDSVADGGSFTLTSGVFSQRPMPGTSAIAMANGAIESFARGAALDVQRGIRVNVVSPPFIKETAVKMGMEGQLTAEQCAETYVAIVEGNQTGTVVFPA